MPWLCWKLLFSMLCMLCTDKGSSLNLDIMNDGNRVVIMNMLMIMYTYLYMPLFDKVVRDHDCFKLMFVCIPVCMYVVVL